jgi:hypothetical protein
MARGGVVLHGSKGRPSNASSRLPPPAASKSDSRVQGRPPPFPRTDLAQCRSNLATDPAHVRRYTTKRGDAVGSQIRDDGSESRMAMTDANRPAMEEVG